MEVKYLFPFLPGSLPCRHLLSPIGVPHMAPAEQISLLTARVCDQEKEIRELANIAADRRRCGDLRRDREFSQVKHALRESRKDNTSLRTALDVDQTAPPSGSISPTPPPVAAKLGAFRRAVLKCGPDFNSLLASDVSTELGSTLSSASTSTSVSRSCSPPAIR